MTKAASPLLEILNEIMPRRLSPLGEAAIETYESLPGVAGWLPPAGFQPFQAHRILEVAWPFVILGENPSLLRLQKKAMGRKFSADEMSVIHAGALLTKLGAHVEFLKEAKQRTPDIQASWAGATVDAEVTTPLVKERQRELERFMLLLDEVIVDGARVWHPLIHLADVPEANAQNQILEAATSLQTGQRIGVHENWELLAVPPDRAAMLLNHDDLESLRPVWWKNDGPSLRVMRTSISSDPEHERRTLICSEMPFLSYLNSIRAKVDRPQRDASNSYLVIVDQAAMPVRHTKLRQELLPWMQQWKHVGGILCFDARPTYCGTFFWQLSFHSNPHAQMPLPGALASIPQEQRLGADFF